MFLHLRSSGPGLYGLYKDLPPLGCWLPSSPSVFLQTLPLERMSRRAKEDGCHPLCAWTNGLAARIRSWVNWSPSPSCPLATYVTWSEAHARVNTLILSSTIQRPHALVIYLTSLHSLGSTKLTIMCVRKRCLEKPPCKTGGPPVVGQVCRSCAYSGWEGRAPRLHRSTRWQPIVTNRWS